MIFSIDRFEGEYVILISDDDAIRREKRVGFPSGICEGDVFVLENDVFLPFESAAEARKHMVRAWMNGRIKKES